MSGTLQQKAVPTTTPTMEEKPKIDEEYVMIKMMEQNLEGVMFHLFEVDFYNLFDLKGFSAMHKYQSRQEMGNLGRLKNEYIKKYNKLPQIETEYTDYWKDNKGLYKGISHEEISELVKNSIKKYADWETEVLEHLLKWKRNSSERELIHNMVEDVMKELKQVETLIDILEEHNYNYECICELSDYLQRRF